MSTTAAMMPVDQERARDLRHALHDALTSVQNSAAWSAACALHGMGEPYDRFCIRRAGRSARRAMLANEFRNLLWEEDDAAD